MGATQTDTSQYIALDHQFGVPLITLIVTLCACALFWALYRERKILGRPTTALFAVLRIVAITTVLWMLLSPTSVLEESTSTKKAVAVLTDVSASMSTVDPAGTADDERWSNHRSSGKASQGEDSGGNLANDHQDSADGRTRSADRAVAALGIAYRELNQAVDTLNQHGTRQAVTSHVSLASEAIERSKVHLDAIGAPIRDQNSEDVEAESIDSLVRRLVRLLQSPEYESFHELAETLQRDRTPSETGWRESLPDLIGRTATTRRVFKELADRLALAERQSMKPVAQKERKTFHNDNRIERVESFLRHLQASTLDTIGETAQVRWSCFDSTPRDLRSANETTKFLADLAGREDLSRQTDLAAALTHVDRMQQEQPVAATFVFSDVAHNHSQKRKPTEIASQIDGSPVYVIPIGNPSRLRDIDLVSTTGPSVAMRNDEVVIEAHLEAYQCEGETCLVQLMRDGQVVDFRNVLLDSDSASRSVRFDQRVSEIGKASFQISVQPLDGEKTEENNFGDVEINVTRSDIKVLLADELPRWEYRYLAQLFRRDPKVDVDELLYRPRLIATGRRAESGGFPVTVDQWDQYDVIILGDIPTDHFPVVAQESLLQYLRSRGGTLITIAGARAMPQSYVDHPLDEIIPVRPIDQTASPDTNGFSFQVTPLGKSHAALMIGETEQATEDAWEFVNRFSPLHQVSPWRTPLPSARSLIAAVRRGESESNMSADLDSSTFLCWQPVGRGRIVYLSGPDTYRLRFLRGDRLHYRFWGQLMRWAIASDLSAGSQSVRIRTSDTRYTTDQPILAEVQLMDAEGSPVLYDGNDSDELSLRLTAGDEETVVPLTAETERPGHYRAELSSLPAGVYQARPAGALVDSLRAAEDDPAVATFTVQANLPTELVDTRCNRVLAGQVSDLTGGQVLPPTAVAEVLALTDLNPVVTHRIQRQPLWLRWKYLWLVFGCLQTEWIIRKWRGLS